LFDRYSNPKNAAKVQNIVERRGKSKGELKLFNVI